jgi:hypothetical protein
MNSLPIALFLIDTRQPLLISHPFGIPTLAGTAIHLREAGGWHSVRQEVWRSLAGCFEFRVRIAQQPALPLHLRPSPRPSPCLPTLSRAPHPCPLPGSEASPTGSTAARGGRLSGRGAPAPPGPTWPAPGRRAGACRPPPPRRAGL